MLEISFFDQLIDDAEVDERRRIGLAAAGVMRLIACSVVLIDSQFRPRVLVRPFGVGGAVAVHSPLDLEHRQWPGSYFPAREGVKDGQGSGSPAAPVQVNVSTLDSRSPRAISKP
jgi:hypothetical protein